MFQKTSNFSHRYLYSIRHPSESMGSSGLIRNIFDWLLAPADMKYHVPWSRHLLACLLYALGTTLLVGARAVNFNPRFHYFSSPDFTDSELAALHCWPAASALLLPDSFVRQAIWSRNCWFTMGQEKGHADCSACSQESHPSLLLMLVRCKMGCCTFKICFSNLDLKHEKLVLMKAARELHPNQHCGNNERGQERKSTPRLAKQFGKLAFLLIQFLFM